MSCPCENTWAPSYTVGASLVEHESCSSRTLITGAALALVLLAFASFPQSAFGATWPVEGARLSASLGFHEEYTAGISKKSYVHSGIDITASAGSQIVSPIAGTVCFTGSIPSGDSALNGGGTGQTTKGVSLKMQDGRTVTLMPVDDITVKRGEWVSEGAPVGKLAASGDRSMRAPHLHMGLKQGRTYFDPLALFGLGPTKGHHAQEARTGGHALAAVSSAEKPKASAEVESAVEVPAPAAELAGSPAIAPAGNPAPTPAGSSAEDAVGWPAEEALLAPQTASRPELAVQETGAGAEEFGTITSGNASWSPRPESPLVVGELQEALAGIAAACEEQASAFADALEGIGLPRSMSYPVLAATVLAFALALGAAGAALCARWLARNVQGMRNVRKSFLVYLKAG